VPHVPPAAADPHDHDDAVTRIAVVLADVTFECFTKLDVAASATVADVLNAALVRQRELGYETSATSCYGLKVYHDNLGSMPFLDVTTVWSTLVKTVAVPKHTATSPEGVHAVKLALCRKPLQLDIEVYCHAAIIPGSGSSARISHRDTDDRSRTRSGSRAGGVPSRAELQITYDQGDFVCAQQVIDFVRRTEPLAKNVFADDGALYWVRGGKHFNVWLKNGDYLSAYDFDDASVKLAYKPKPVPFKIQFKDGTSVFCEFEHDVEAEYLVRVVAKLTALPLQHVPDYGLWVEFGGHAGSFLDNANVAMLFDDRHSVALRFVMRPQPVLVSTRLAQHEKLIAKRDKQDEPWQDKGDVRVGVCFARAVIDVEAELCEHLGLVGVDTASDTMLLLADGDASGGGGGDSDSNRGALVKWLPLRAQAPYGCHLILTAADKNMLAKNDGNRVNLWEEERTENTLVVEGGAGGGGGAAGGDDAGGGGGGGGGDIVKILHATFNQLVIYLTNETAQDVAFENAFMHTYRTFCTADALIGKLKERFNVPSSGGSKSQADVIRLRVCLALRRFLEVYEEDDEEPLNLAAAFVAECVDADAAAAKVSPLLTRGIGDARKRVRALVEECQQIDAMQADKASDESVFTPDDSPLAKVVALGDDASSPYLAFAAIEPQVLAQQLALDDYKVYCDIRPREFYRQAWTRPRRALAPNVRALIDRFNRLSGVVSTALVREPRLSRRVALLEYYVAVMRNLLELQAFSALMAFVAALSNSPLLRLKHTRAKVGKKCALALADMEKLMHMQGSYKRYRTHLRHCTAPCTPYLGVFLMDLTFIDEGNPNVVNGIINWQKRELVWHVIDELTGYMSGGAYAIKHNERVAAFLDAQPHLSEKTLYSCSLQIEPRRAELRDLAQ